MNLSTHTALLLIPQQMGKRKYTMRSKLWGRNMLIAEFLWIAYCASLPPGTEPDPKMKRKRKQVSSHIQVLKNFFLNHRCCKCVFEFVRKKNSLPVLSRRSVQPHLHAKRTSLPLTHTPCHVAQANISFSGSCRAPSSSLLSHTSQTPLCLLFLSHLSCRFCIILWRTLRT